MTLFQIIDFYFTVNCTEMTRDFDYPCCVTRSPFDVRDWKYHEKTMPLLAKAREFPLQFSWIPYLPSVRDQGNEGTCAAFSGATLKEAHEHKENTKLDKNVCMSPRFIYTYRENAPNEGMYLRDLMKILQKQGTCFEATLPYSAGSPLKPENVPTNAVDEGANFKVAHYAQVYSILDLKQALIEQGPCIAAFPVYNNGSQFWKPQSPTDSLKGGHAVTIVGYDDEKQGFHIRNSWGDDWAEDGYTWYPYIDFGMHWEIWSAIDDASLPIQPPEVEPTFKCGEGCVIC